MCGIAIRDGVHDGPSGHTPHRLDAEFTLVHRMCDVIRHRGPDDEGSVEPGIGLGMRRLSIIDAGWPQDSQSQDHLGGLQRRIYNYASCGRSSSPRHRFYSSDTESIVHAQSGEDVRRCAAYPIAL